MIEVIVLFTIFAAGVFVYGLFSKRLERTILSAQMVFVVVGLLLSPGGGNLLDLGPAPEFVLIIGEIALVLTLFVDASRINLRSLRGAATMPGRMLLVGLPLTVALGTAIAAYTFADLTIAEAALLGAILAPTDAALGQAVVNNPAIPVRIRQTLNVESGLNDGASVPFFLVFLALAAGEALDQPLGTFAVTALEQIGIGVLVGIAVGGIGTWCIVYAARRGWMNTTFRWMSFVALALVSFGAADSFGGSPFIAAFVGGLTAAMIRHGLLDRVVEYAETDGEILNLAIFFLFGFFGATFLAGTDWPVVLYAVLSLTAIRMIPVAISLIGMHLSRPTVLFLGWFGPRGLASIVLLLIAVTEEEGIPGIQTVGQVVVATVLLSVFVHGISANPLSDWYARHVAELEPGRPEMEEVPELPTRRQMGTDTSVQERQ
jgi:NhaP-type Na+/H+ or K+/H+ antiporter